MRRYYFDVRKGEEASPDVEGFHLLNNQAAWTEATESLADMMRDNVRNGEPGADHRMEIEVRDGHGPW